MLWLYLLTLTLAGINGENFVLKGSLTEFLGEPVIIRCEVDYGYIRLGGITLNNEELDAAEQTKAKAQCETQMDQVVIDRQELVTSRKAAVKGTKCVVTFSGLNVTETDTVRVVYNCYPSKPSGSPPWGEEDGKLNLKKAKIEGVGTLTVSCEKQKQMLFIHGSKLNGEATDHPDLEPVHLTQVCMGDWARNLEDAVKKYDRPTCLIENKESYGGELEITYTCIDSKKSASK